VIPPDAYRGTSPIASIVDAYSDPVYDPTQHRLQFLGGGHGDGSCNAIVGLDLATLKYELTAAPTPSTAYPPGYLVQTPYVYPSGLPLAWFHTAAQLTDSQDTPFAAPFSAPIQTHQYGSQAVRAKKGVAREIHYFYSQYKVFDLDAGAWTQAHEQGADFIAQRVAAQAELQSPGLGANIGPATPLQQGTMAVYDDVTDAFFVTLIPGDAGGGWRNFFFRYEPATQKVTKIYRPEVPCRESMTWLRAGRWIYGITSPYSIPYPGMTLNTGFRFNIDTEVTEYFKITGDVVSFNIGSEQEAAPGFYDVEHDTIYSWNHNAADRAGLYELTPSDLGKSGGAGTAADPWVWPQTHVLLGGTPPAEVAYHYNGLYYLADWQVMVVLSRWQPAHFQVATGELEGRPEASSRP
jgi:hypothetical protein